MKIYKYGHNEMFGIHSVIINMFLLSYKKYPENNA